MITVNEHVTKILMGEAIRTGIKNGLEHSGEHKDKLKTPDDIADFLTYNAMQEIMSRFDFGSPAVKVAAELQEMLNEPEPKEGEKSDEQP